MGRHKRKIATWTMNLPNRDLPKKKKTKHSVSEGGEDKENIPEHAEGLNTSSNLPLSSLSTPQRPKEPSQAGVGQLPRKEPERIQTLGNQTLAVSNMSNA